MEDDPADAALIAASLERSERPTSIHRVANRQELEQALHRAWDLVLCDYSLPDLEGAETLHLIRAVDEHVPVIFVSAALGEERAVELLRRGATDFVLKHRPERLLYCVRRALEEARMRRDSRAWQRSAALALAIAENASHGLLAFDAGGRCLFLNPAAQRMLGYSYAETQNSQRSWHELVHPACQGCDLQSGASAGEVVLRKSDGQELPVAFTATPLREAERTFGTVLELRDITGERRRRELLEASEAYHREAAELEKRARAEAELANRMKDDFIATISHELRTPLTAMLGWMRLLRRKITDREREEGLQILESSTRTLAKLVEDLLDVSRILAGKLKLELQPLDLAELVERSVRAFEPAAASKSIGLSVNVADRPRIVGDPVRLNQVVSNLVNNALKFTSSGGTVVVTVLESDGSACVCVADDGQGIAPANLDRLFQRFSQVHRGSSNRRFSGLGLGLSIVRDIVELHQGSVEAHSDGEGMGAQFCFRIPCTPEAVEHLTRAAMLSH